MLEVRDHVRKPKKETGRKKGLMQDTFGPRQLALTFPLAQLVSSTRPRSLSLLLTAIVPTIQITQIRDLYHINEMLAEAESYQPVPDITARRPCVGGQRLSASEITFDVVLRMADRQPLRERTHHSVVSQGPFSF